MVWARVGGIVVGLAVLAAFALGCGTGGGGGSQANGGASLSARQIISAYVAAQPRTAKAKLIEQLKSPPKVVIFGGSRAMAFDPATIRRLTGLSAFNAAVTQARPEDTWALLNLLHSRFPSARFRFLWVVHADELDPRPLDPAVLLNPALARYFPRALVTSQSAGALALAREMRRRVQIDVPHQDRFVYAPDGFVRRGFFSGVTPPLNGHVGAVEANVQRQVAIYASTPVALYPRSVTYFERDLRLMDSLAVTPPVIVAAPFDRRIYVATVNHGWLVRHRLLLGLLSRLQKKYSFSFLDLSNAAACGFAPNEFYDGIHLTPQGAQRVIDLVLQRFPHAL